VDAEQTIEAALADPHVARLLEVAPGAPILRIRFTFREADGRPVNDVTYHYRADRYVYTAHLAAGPARPPGARTVPAASLRGRRSTWRQSR
jgi:GntR family transcriptional regulator